MFPSVRHFALNTERHGAIAVLAAALLVVIFAFTAFTVDLGFVALVDQELQGAVDASALAAAYELKQAKTTDSVFNAAEELAALNTVNGHALSVIRDSDVEVGYWDELTRTFTAMPGLTDLSLSNAVRVNGRLNRARDSQVRLFFAPILGHSNVERESSAIAVIGRDRPRDVMLVIDRSGSMKDYHRLDYTKSAAIELVSELQELVSRITGDETKGDRVGLAAYSFQESGNGQSGTWRERNGGTTWEGRLITSLSWKFSTTRLQIPLLTPSGNTNIGGGMRVAIEELIAHKRYDSPGREVEQYLVLMTDGHANETEPPGTTPVNSIYYYAQLAKQNHITIHGITLGSDAEEAPIRYAAELTGGEYHHVEDGDFEGLFEVYRGIGLGRDQPRLVR
ncbi:VWA domain-containing protein [bacterium]|nr:VWA domain-containing protein [bacterium]